LDLKTVPLKIQAAAKASFEHDWNNNKHCGLGCQAKSWTEEEKVRFKSKYRNKVRNTKEYNQQLEVKEKYFSKTRLRRCYQDYCNIKTK
jgi:hypothetical protein